MKIPFLHARRLAGGGVAWHWQPSPRLRKAGWANRLLGRSDGRAPSREIVEQALELNRQVESWDRGAAAVAPARPVPRKWTFGDLVTAYKASSEWAELADATRREYDVRLRQLTWWADEGRLPVSQLDPQMVADLRAALMGASRFKCASTLRVLRLLLNWAKAPARRIITENVTDGVRIPGTPSRQAKLSLVQTEAVAVASERLGDHATALAIRVGFWSLQRRSDMLGLNRLAWRTFENLDPRDRPALAGERGDVRGFRLRQRKTGVWVDAPIPPMLHPAIDAAFVRSQWLFADPADPERPLHPKALERSARAALDAAGFPGHQFRDLRRSGMSWMKDMGALQSNVFAISGHAVMGKRSIVDTYMPPDTLAACAAVAAALRTLARIEQREAGQDHG